MLAIEELPRAKPAIRVGVHSTRDGTTSRRMLAQSVASHPRAAAHKVESHHRLRFACWALQGRFASPLLLASLRQQFLDPLSGGSDSTTRLFALIKTRDDRKAVGGNTATHGGVGQIQQHVDATATISSASALESEWVMPLLAEAVIVDGSGGDMGSDRCGTRGVQEQQCERFNERSAARTMRWQSHRPPDDSCRVLRRNTANLDATLNDRMVKNLLSFKWCFGAIERYEMASGKPFEVVAYTRPDMLRLEPMRPWVSGPTFERMLSHAPLRRTTATLSRRGMMRVRCWRASSRPTKAATTPVHGIMSEVRGQRCLLAAALAQKAFCDT